MDHDSPIDFDDPVWAIVQSLPSMLSYWDRDLQCRFANQAYKRWFGVRASQLFDSSLRDLLGPELFARSEPYIRGVLQGIPQEFDRMSVDSRRPERPGLVNYLPHVVNGKVLGFIVQVTDVSRLHEMKAQLQQQSLETEKACALLRQSEADLQQAQTLGQIGSWEFDVASDTNTWSMQLYELFGRDPALDPPNLGEHALCFSPESWRRFERTVDRALPGRGRHAGARIHPRQRAPGMARGARRCVAGQAWRGRGAARYGAGNLETKALERRGKTGGADR